MIEQALAAIFEHDDALAFGRAVDEMFPFTETCVSYWGLVNALYGGRPLTNAQLHHVASCEHCAGRAARMLDRECPSPRVIKAAFSEDQSVLSHLIERHAEEHKCIRCKLWIEAVRPMATGIVLPLPRLALGVSFAPASEVAFEPARRQKLDEATEAVLTVENEELVVHVDSTQAAKIRLALVPEELDDDSSPIPEATLTLRRVSENDWTGAHNFGAVSALRADWGTFTVLAAIDRGKP